MKKSSTMKRLIMSLMGILLFTGCSRTDYYYSIYFEIVNWTNADIIIVKRGEAGETINPGERATISRLGGDCGKNMVPGDDYSDSPEKMMQISTFSDIIIQIKVGENLMSDCVWKRKYWEFANKTYRATYTLNLTDELIESIGFE